MDVAIIVMIVILVFALFAVIGFYVDKKEQVTRNRIKKYRDTVLKHIGEEKQDSIHTEVQSGSIKSSTPIIEEQEKVEENTVLENRDIESHIVDLDGSEGSTSESEEEPVVQDLERVEYQDARNVDIGEVGKFIEEENSSMEEEQVESEDIENEKELMINEPTTAFEEEVDLGYESFGPPEYEEQMQTESEKSTMVEESSFEKPVQEEVVETYEPVSESDMEDTEVETVEEEKPEEVVETYEPISEPNMEDTEVETIEEEKPEEVVETYEPISEPNIEDTEVETVEEEKPEEVVETYEPISEPNIEDTEVETIEEEKPEEVVETYEPISESNIEDTEVETIEEEKPEEVVETYEPTSEPNIEDTEMETIEGESPEEITFENEDKEDVETNESEKQADQNVDTTLEVIESESDVGRGEEDSSRDGLSSNEQSDSEKNNFLEEVLTADEFKEDDTKDFNADALILEGIPEIDGNKESESDIFASELPSEKGLFGDYSADDGKEPFSSDEFTLDNIPYMEPVDFETSTAKSLYGSNTLKSELTDGSGDLILDNEIGIDKEFESLLQEDVELKQQFTSLDNEKKEEFKSLDDEDEDLWSF